jgi:hypothetical protein
MMAKVMAILVPFLSFATTYIPNKAHNMLVLMLDTCFKCLNVVKAFVGRAKTMEKVAKYDTKSLMVLIVVAFHLQNLSSIDLIDALMVVDEDSISCLVTSNKITM